MQLSFITNLLTVKLKNMRKTKFSIICLSALLAGNMTFTSCGDDDDKSTNGGNGEIDKPIEPVKPDDKTVMTSQEQKQYLETVAKEFMNTIPSKDFKEMSDLGKYISDVYAQQYEWDAVETWGEDIMNELLQATDTKDTETDDWGYTYIYTNYKALIQASNFTGHFTARNGKWNLTQANDLQFIFADENGKECVLKLKTSGNVKKVHMFNIDDWTDYDSYYDEEANRYYSTEYYDRTAYTLGVPENIEVTLSRGGSNMVKTAVKIDLNGISNEEFDLSKGNLSLSCTTEFDNGYKLDVSKVTYTGNKDVSVTTKLSKGDKSLVSIAVASDLSGIPSCNISAFTESDEDYDEDEEDEEDEYKDANAKNAFVKIDIIGKLQMQGKITDVKKFSNYLDNADENDENEARFKSYINQANGMMDMGIFYDGKSVKQADVQFEPFMEGNSYYSYWYCEPVLKFQDGSSYSTFEAFFNETDFKSVIDLFFDLTDQYADLLDSDNW